MGWRHVWKWAWHNYWGAIRDIHHYVPTIQLFIFNFSWLLTWRFGRDLLVPYDVVGVCVMPLIRLVSGWNYQRRICKLGQMDLHVPPPPPPRRAILLGTVYSPTIHSTSTNGPGMSRTALMWSIQVGCHYGSVFCLRAYKLQYMMSTNVFPVLAEQIPFSWRWPTLWHVTNGTRILTVLDVDTQTKDNFSRGCRGKNIEALNK